MAELGYPTCPACGERPGRAAVFCTACWVDVPQRLRTAIAESWNALRNRPASKSKRADYDDAIAAAVAAVTR